MFNNFIITDISNCPYKFDENILFDSVPPIIIQKTAGNLE